MRSFGSASAASRVLSSCLRRIWTVDYDATGPDEAARGGIDAIYGVMAGWLQDAATG